MTQTNSNPCQIPAARSSVSGLIYGKADGTLGSTFGRETGIDVVRRAVMAKMRLKILQYSHSLKSSQKNTAHRCKCNVLTVPRI